MDSLQFKEAKTVWRFIVLFSDIRTINHIFQLCRENRELGEEEPLWNCLCIRDFGRKGNKQVYFTCFKYGSYYSVNDTHNLHYWDPNLSIPLSVSIHKDALFVFYRTRNKTKDLISCDTPRISTKHNYCITSDCRDVVSAGDPCIDRYYIKPLMIWILEHFEATNVYIGRKSINFFGQLRRQYVPFSNKKDLTRTCEYHKATYQGILYRGEVSIKVRQREGTIEEMPVIDK